MKKLKLFLLGLIITLFGIGSFSSAKSFTFIEGTDNKYSPDYFSTDIPLSDYNWDSLSFVCDQPVGKGCRVVFYNGSSRVCYINYYRYVNGTIQHDNTCETSSYVGNLIVKKNPNDNFFSSITINDGVPEGFNVMNNLIPAIDGLHITIIELIPYIVFIGFGMIIVTLGFYAIRRLVNWMLGKFNSKFISKRD